MVIQKAQWSPVNLKLLPMKHDPYSIVMVGSWPLASCIPVHSVVLTGRGADAGTAIGVCHQQIWLKCRVWSAVLPWSLSSSRSTRSKWCLLVLWRTKEIGLFWSSVFFLGGAYLIPHLDLFHLSFPLSFSLSLFLLHSSHSHIWIYPHQLLLLCICNSCSFISVSVYLHALATLPPTVPPLILWLHHYLISSFSMECMFLLHILFLSSQSYHFTEIPPTWPTSSYTELLKQVYLFIS